MSRNGDYRAISRSAWCNLRFSMMHAFRLRALVPNTTIASVSYLTSGFVCVSSAILIDARMHVLAAVAASTPIGHVGC